MNKTYYITDDAWNRKTTEELKRLIRKYSKEVNNIKKLFDRDSWESRAFSDIGDLFGKTKKGQLKVANFSGLSDKELLLRARMLNNLLREETSSPFSERELSEATRKAKLTFENRFSDQLGGKSLTNDEYENLVELFNVFKDESMAMSSEQMMDYIEKASDLNDRELMDIFIENVKREGLTNRDRYDLIVKDIKNKKLNKR